MIFDHFAAAMFAAKIPLRGCQVSHFSDHNSKGSWPAHFPYERQAEKF